MFKETMRIIYNNQANARTATLKFTYNEVELSVTFECDAGAYFERVFNGNFSSSEKEFIYSALVYCDAVARGAISPGFWSQRQMIAAVI